MTLQGYRIHNLILESSTCLVFRATREADQKTVLLKLPTFQNPGWINQYWQEYRVWNHLSHPNLLQIEGLEVIDSSPVLVLENFDGVPFQDLWQETSGNVAQCLRIAIACIQLLDHLYQAQIDLTEISFESFLIHRETGQLKLFHLGIDSQQVFSGNEEIHAPSGSLNQRLETILADWLGALPTEGNQAFQTILQQLLDAFHAEGSNITTKNMIRDLEAALYQQEESKAQTHPLDWSQLMQAVSTLNAQKNLLGLGRTILDLFHIYAAAQGSILFVPDGQDHWQVQSSLGPTEQSCFLWPASTPLSQLPNWLQNVVKRVQKAGTCCSTAPSEFQVEHHWCSYPLKVKDQLMGIVYLDYGVQADSYVPPNATVTEFIASQGAIALQNHQLQQKVALSASIFETTQEGVAVIEGDRFVSVNESLAQSFGKAPEDMIGKDWRFFFVADHHTLLENQASGLLQKQTHWEGALSCISAKAEQFETWFKLTRTSKDQIVSVSRDLRQQQHIEKELKDTKAKNDGLLSRIQMLQSQLKAALKDFERSEAKFEQVFDKAADPVLILSDSGFIDCNQAALSLFKFEQKHQLILQNLARISPEYQPDGQSSLFKIQEMIAIAQEKGFHRFEWLHKSSRNDLFWAEVNLTPIRYDNKPLIHCLVRDINDRKQIEKSLQRSEGLANASFEQAAVGMVEIDLFSGHFVRFNDFFCKLFGYPQDELKALTIYDLTYSEDLDKTSLNLEKMRDGQIDHYHIEKRYVRKNGSVFWASIHVSKVSLANSSIIRSFAVIRDVSDRKLAEVSLAKSQQRYHALITSLNGVLWEYDHKEKQFTYVSEQSEEFLGYPLEQWSKEEFFWSRKIYLEDRQSVVAQFNQSSRENSSFEAEYRMVRTNGEVIWVSHQSNVQCDVEGRRVVSRGMLRDISTQKYTEQKLKFTQFAVDQSADIIIYTTSQGMIASVNQSACQHLGMTQDELNGRSLFDLPFQISECHWKSLWQTMKIDKTAFWESEHKPPNGLLFPIEILAYLFDYEGQDFCCLRIRNITLRKAREKSTLMAQYAIDKSAISSFWCTQAGEITNVNSAACQTLEYSHAELTALRAWTVGLHKSGLSWTEFWEHIEGVGAEVFEAKVKGNQSQSFLAEISANYFEYDDQAYIFFQVQDITERKKSELLLKENEQRFRQLFRSTPQIAMQVYDKDRTLIEWNDASTSFYGYDREEALGQKLEDLIVPEPMREPVVDAVVAWVEQDIPIPATEITLQDKNGDPVHVFSSHFLSRNINNEPELYCLDIDLKDRKIAEENLRQSQQLLQLVLDTIPQQVFWKDRQSVYLGCNYLYAEAMGFTSSQDIIGKKDEELYWDEHRHRNQYESETRVMNGNEAEIEVYESQRSPLDSRSIWFESNTFPLHDDQGDVMGVLGLISDITQKKFAQETLQRLNDSLESKVFERTGALINANEELLKAKDRADAANRAKSDFLARMSHELRTPLNGILGYAQILERSDLLGESEKKGIVTIRHCGVHLLSLINDILDLAKIEANKLELNLDLVHLPSLLEQVRQIIQVKTDQKGLIFEASIDSSLPEMVALDAKRLRQVLFNLLDNAVKFTPEGTVKFSVTCLQVIPNDQVVLKVNVQDSGVGISPDCVDQIFDAFEQVGESRKKIEGTGLGLAISQRIMKLMDSEIQVKSTVGQGTSFGFELTLGLKGHGRETALSYAVPETVVGYVGEPRLILYVDDHRHNSDVFSQLMTPLGFNVVTAINGNEALSILHTMKPDLIVTDLIMPNMDGYQLLQYLREHQTLSSIPVIVASASVSPEEQDKSLSMGAKAFLTKPINRHELLQIMGDVLEIHWIAADEVFALEADGSEPTRDIEQWQLPPLETLDHLLRLAERGLLSRIQNELKRLKAVNSEWLPFLEALEQHAVNFEPEQIEQILRQLLPAIAS